MTKKIIEKYPACKEIKKIIINGCEFFFNSLGQNFFYYLIYGIFFRFGGGGGRKKIK